MPRSDAQPTADSSPTIYGDVGVASPGYIFCPDIRLVERILARSVPEPNSGCLLWEGATDQRGYGVICSDGRTLRVHRVMLESRIGRHLRPWPEEHACHSCDNPSCCNPDHLWPGNALTNAWDSCRKGRRARRTTEPVAVEVECLRVLAELEKEGASPVGFDELAKRMGVTPGCAHSRCYALHMCGLVTSERYRKRTLRITDDGWEYLRRSA